MYRLELSRSGLLYAADLEVGFDIVAGYTEADLAAEREPFKDAFRTLMRKLRLDKGLPITKLSKKIDVSEEALSKLEREKDFKPDPRTLYKLAGFYKIPIEALIQLAGAKHKSGSMIKRGIVEFALKSESLEKLSKEEKKLLKQFVEVLRSEYGD